MTEEVWEYEFESIDEAMLILDRQQWGIPYDAIRYLRNQPDSDKLTEKIIFSLEHAYSEIYYDQDENFEYSTPLWYAIVAETHISERLIDPVINLFITAEYDWDFMNEQGMYLICLLAARYPEQVMSTIMEVIDNLIEEVSDLPYLYLFDAFYYVDGEKYKDWFLGTLQKEGLYWEDAFVHHLADLKIKEAIPIIKDWLIRNRGNVPAYMTAEFEASLEKLETGVCECPDSCKPYSEERDEWEKHYSEFEDRFEKKEEKKEEEKKELKPIMPEPVKMVKIGRNDPCPCGSGKKYKKCCLDKVTGAA